ncbi:thymidine phosphorylase family protein [Fodinibius sediminis]|uniref:thymidine phosphorylase n=1 Tax=Fodinibius sediminis TaxID=1214077 RepID=A0A521CM15_9BACT|nr:thymidine phosphorylase family protein [Fodinibius sediminis]SMO60476.1 thymidine phosphorylase [Fodinibius sediminis]
MDSGLTNLRLKWLGIDTQKEFVVYMRSDCPVCISEGFEALTRVMVRVGNTTIIATLNVIHSDLLARDEASLSTSAWNKLEAREGDEIHFSHLQPAQSMSRVRAKIYGETLERGDYDQIIADIIDHKYSTPELAAFVTSCAGERLQLDEIIALTRAMVSTGSRLQWNREIIADKHCVGGLPGNRTTPIIVAIAAVAGLAIPKTSSRAITSPAGTVDTMETMAPVNLSMDHVRQVVEQVGGCVVWGSGVNLSPADDILIGVERALDIDSEGQMIASVLSKKVAAGSTHVVIDMPVGPTAKVRTPEAAQQLSRYFELVADAIDLKVKVILTEGIQPVGRGIGPALEAADVLSVLRNDQDAPDDLRQRSLMLAGSLLELTGQAAEGDGPARADAILRSGKAWEKFYAICEAQGGFRIPGKAPYTREIKAGHSGFILSIDNRRLAKVAKLAGAPHDPTAGLMLQAVPGHRVESGQPLFTVHAETRGTLEYALEYIDTQPDILEITS